MQAYLDFAKTMAEEAGHIMLKYFKAQEVGLQIKSDMTPVTLADTEINALVIAKVKELFPGHGVVGEEESFNTDKPDLWIVDPLDGTANFSRKIPLFAFSMALVSNGNPLVAVVYDPVTARMLHAISGQGAYDGASKLDVADKTSDNLTISSWVVGGIDNSIFDDRTVHGKIADCYARSNFIEEMDVPIAYALALVGTGDLDGVVSSIKTPWDVVAGALIAKEAGAISTDLFGRQVEDWSKEANGTLTAAPSNHSRLQEVIKPAIETAK